MLGKDNTGDILINSKVSDGYSIRRISKETNNFFVRILKDMILTSALEEGLEMEVDANNVLPAVSKSIFLEKANDYYFITRIKSNISYQTQVVNIKKIYNKYFITTMQVGVRKNMMTLEKENTIILHSHHTMSAMHMKSIDMLIDIYKKIAKNIKVFKYKVKRENFSILNNAKLISQMLGIHFDGYLDYNICTDQINYQLNDYPSTIGAYPIHFKCKEFADNFLNLKFPTKKDQILNYKFFSGSIFGPAYIYHTWDKWDKEKLATSVKYIWLERLVSREKWMQMVAEFYPSEFANLATNDFLYIIGDTNEGY